MPRPAIHTHPRLVTLDEAFAGVDDNARAKYLGLLAAFRPGRGDDQRAGVGAATRRYRAWAISQLSRTDEVAAVLVTSWEWDGASRRRTQRPMRPVAPAAANPELGAAR